VEVKKNVFFRDYFAFKVLLIYCKAL
jgi:hypothetical protein